jgi:hypothetical protein
MNLILARDESFWPPKEETVKPHPIHVVRAKHALIAALHNYHQITTGRSEDFANWSEMATAERDFLNQRVPMVERAVWGL